MQGFDEEAQHDLLRLAVQARALAERDLELESQARLLAEREVEALRLSSPPSRRLLAACAASRAWHQLARAVQRVRRDPWVRRSYGSYIEPQSVASRGLRTELGSELARRRGAETAWASERRRRARADWELRALRSGWRALPAPGRARGHARAHPRPALADAPPGTHRRELWDRVAATAATSEPLRVHLAAGARAPLEEAIRSLGWSVVASPAAAELALDIGGDGRLRLDSILAGEREPASVSLSPRGVSPDELSEAVRTALRRPAILVRVGGAELDPARSGGDYLLARSLCRALARRGHEAAIGPAGAAEASRGRMADLVLTIRGRGTVAATPGQVALVWLISHPEDVSHDELERCDAVLVASRTYARRLEGQLSVPVHPLLQFTDPALFYPDSDPGAGHDVAFVGNMRSVLRPIVWDAIRSGHAPALYGEGWRFVAPELAVAGHVEPHRVRKIYSSSKVVLNDHWEDMRRHGFVNNRVYDVLACGGFLLSDRLPELAEEFGDAVETYAGRRELAAKLDFYLLRGREREARGRRGREIVLERHTADHRAAKLLAIVEATMRRRGLSGPDAGR
ncbi:MAG: CgeB family protein [Egibacteraceae bacterium]